MTAPRDDRAAVPQPDPHEAAGAASIADRLRAFVLAIVALGVGGLLAELLLLEHYEDPWQFAPLVLLGLGAVVLAWHAVSRSASSVKAMRVLMTLCLVAGAIGVVLHLKGNYEFELESDPELRGTALLWKALIGATPALAPGALAQLGLLGLAYTWRHPALGPRR